MITATTKKLKTKAKRHYDNNFLPSLFVFTISASFVYS